MRVVGLFGRHYHPIWTLIASCVLMAVGLILLFANFPWLALIIVVAAVVLWLNWYRWEVQPW